MQKSFSIVNDDEDSDDGRNNVTEIDEAILKKYGGALASGKSEEDLDAKHVPRLLDLDINDSDTEDDAFSVSKKNPARLTSAGPSGRKTLLRSRPAPISSESDSDYEGNVNKLKNNSIPGEYDPKKYENLDVNEEAKNIFQYITKYIPQAINLEYKFKPFVPEFLPAVGDIDAFLKVIPPSATFLGEHFDGDLQLGLTVLDEPAANQSDSALLHLQLRAESVSVSTNQDTNMIVKKVDNVEKNGKVIEKWIKDISALHKSKSSPTVRYSEPMPDLDELMQEWTEQMEDQVKGESFLQPKNASLSDYVEEVCLVFNIPTKNKIHSLHLLFSLYAAVKSTQLFKNFQMNKTTKPIEEMNQLVLD